MSRKGPSGRAMWRSLDAETLRAKEQSEIRVGAAVAESRDTAVTQLRADLATVTAELDMSRREHAVSMECFRIASEAFAAERAAHAETHKALELQRDARVTLADEYLSTRAELAKAEARVRELEARMHTMKPDLGYDDEQQ